MNIKPSVLVLTWSNGRCGKERIVKRLDRYFMVEDICDLMGRYHYSSYVIGISDHKAIIL